MISSLVSFLLILSSFNAEIHDFHLSRCEVEYNQEERAIQIGTQIFIDDLELALEEYGVKDLKIGTEKEADNSEEFIAKYLSDRIIIQTGVDSLQFNFLGKEVTEDLTAIWCYMEVADVASMEELSISNSVLMEVFDDQKNITIVSLNKKAVKHFLFQKGEHEGKIEF